jgi:predicted permease
MAGMIANALVPIFFGLGLGYFAGRLGIIDKKNIAGLNTFLMSYALPAALFLATAQTPRQVLGQHGRLFLVLTLSMVSTFFVVLALELKVFKFSLGDSAGITLSVALPNWVSVGLPLFIGLYGPESTSTVAVGIVCGNVVMAPLSLVLLETDAAQGHSGGKLSRFVRGLGRALSKPIVVGPLLGFCLSLAGYTLPAVWVRSVGFYGQAAAGVSLFITGLVLSRESLALDANVSGGLVLKLILQPVWTLIIAGWMLRYPTPLVRDAVLLMACPGAFLGVLLPVIYNARNREAGALLLLSTAASAVTLSAVILLLPLIH